MEVGDGGFLPCFFLFWGLEWFFSLGVSSSFTAFILFLIPKCPILAMVDEKGTFKAIGSFYYSTTAKTNAMTMESLTLHPSALSIALDAAALTCVAG